MYVVQKCDVCQLRIGGNILVDASIGELSASDVAQNLTSVVPSEMLNKPKLGP